MAHHNGNTMKMLTLIKERGTATSVDLFDICGVAAKNQPGMLGRYIDDGTLTTEIVRIASGTGKRATRVRRYTWCGGEQLGHIGTAPKPPSGPQARGMRKCLADGCGRMFMSSSAANRICPRCKSNSEFRAACMGKFDTPHVVLNP